ncbi:hypothetical protein AgCh_000295 [Apium graveolens]
MNRTKLPIRERIENILQFPIGVDVAIAEGDDQWGIRPSTSRKGYLLVSLPDQQDIRFMPWFSPFQNSLDIATLFIIFITEVFKIDKMNRTKLPICKRLENVPQFSGSVDAAVAEVGATNRLEVVLSPNTNGEDRMEVCKSLGVRQVQKPGKYLGMPMNVGSSKTEVFGFLIDRVQQRLKGWYGKDVSRAGKITLLSSAAQTIPCFLDESVLDPSNYM